MSSSDDIDLIIEGSRNLGDDAVDADAGIREESTAIFNSTMKKQGIAIEASDSSVNATSKSLGDFSKELLAQGDIEIVSSEEGE